MRSTAYAWLMLAGVLGSLVFWGRLARRDSRLLFIYLGALTGAFLGAKIVYVASEGWMHWHDENRWLQLATGKSIVGGLLGGYAAVEAVKALLKYRRPTGDWFALIAPIGIMLGRIGCIMQGCCLGRACQAAWYTVNDAAGIPRWPAALAELLFNAAALGLMLVLRRRKLLAGQHFHIYLVLYGLFRFCHEFLRETPRIAGPISGYQIGAAAIAALGIIGFLQRRRDLARVVPSPSAQLVSS